MSKKKDIKKVIFEFEQYVFTIFFQLLTLFFLKVPMRSEPVICHICDTIIYRSDYLATHILLKHSNSQTKYKCPHSENQEICESLFDQVKNFIYHYITQHKKTRSEAKDVAGKGGAKLEKVELTNEGEIVNVSARVKKLKINDSKQERLNRLK